MGEVYNGTRHADQAARTKWGASYRGNAPYGADTAARLLDRYGGYCHAGPEWGPNELQSPQCIATVRRARASAAGMHGWRPREIRVLTMAAVESIVDIRRWVETHGRWPAVLLSSKAVFLSKQQQASMHPEDYRVPLIMPWLDRAWARMRFRARLGPDLGQAAAARRHGWRRGRGCVDEDWHRAGGSQAKRQGGGGHCAGH